MNDDDDRDPSELGNLLGAALCLGMAALGARGLVKTFQSEDQRRLDDALSYGRMSDRQLRGILANKQLATSMWREQSRWLGAFRESQRRKRLRGEAQDL
jgi:hypothetical protein